MQLVGHQAFTPDPLPTSIGGLPTKLLLAVWGNYDSHIQYLAAAEQQQVLQLRSRAFSTDTIEGSFAEINSSMGYKARPQQLKPRLTRLDIPWSLKHGSGQLFHTPRTSRQ